MVNDISGGTLDERMFETVSRLQVPYVLMHMRGTHQTMAQLNTYDELIPEIAQYLAGKIQQLRQSGQNDIIIDPGFGFAKSIRQNFQLLQNLDYFQALGLPLMVGLSRKSMIYKTLEIPVAEALNGTTVVNTLALSKGASILRVHDVREAAEAVKLFVRSNE
jgi:dihydropteroate synthase